MIESMSDEEIESKSKGILEKLNLPNTYGKWNQGCSHEGVAQTLLARPLSGTQISERNIQISFNSQPLQSPWQKHLLWKHEPSISFQF
jgi:hypothetical protein